MDLGPYTTFIVGAYTAALMIMVAMIAWVLIDHRRQKRRDRLVRGDGAIGHERVEIPRGRARFLQRLLVRDVAQRIDRSLAEVDPRCRNPQLTALEAERHGRRRGRFDA